MVFRHVREIDRRFQESRDGRIFCRGAFDAKRERGQRELFIFKLHDSAHQLARKDVLRQFETHLDAGERNGREDARHQNSGDKACEDEKEQIIAGIERGNRHQQNAENVDPAFAGNLEFHAVAHPAKRCALRQNRDKRDSNPRGHGKRAQRKHAREDHVADLRGGAGVQGQEQSDSEGSDGESKRAHAGAVGFSPKLRDGRGETHGSSIHKGTGTESTISRRTDSVASDFFCSEACRELATTRWEKTSTASSLKSSGRQQSRPSRKARACAARCSMRVPRALTPSESWSLWRVRATISSA